MTVASGVSYWQALLPGIIVALLAGAVLPWLDRENNAVRMAVVAVSVALSWRYMAWRLSSTVPPVEAPIDFAFGIAFVAVELLATISGIASHIFLSRTRNRTVEADRNLQGLLSLSSLPQVDVLICTYNEDEEILERTIIGALHIDYPNYRVWVCDDGRRETLKQLCEQHGCGYITRKDNAHAKAGNINNALRHLAILPEKPEFIAILDADFVPKPAFLARTLALTREDDVGIVQTPQHFFNPDPIQTNLSMTRVWPDEQRYFFDIVMASKDAWGEHFAAGRHR
jgi:cellulose synthase (UDP-forming)